MRVLPDDTSVFFVLASDANHILAKETRSDKTLYFATKCHLETFVWKTLLNQAPKKEIYVSENKEIRGEAHHEIIFPSKMYVVLQLVMDRVVPEIRVSEILCIKKAS